VCTQYIVNMNSRFHEPKISRLDMKKLLKDMKNSNNGLAVLMA